MSDGRANNGGPRPKVREDDRRGVNHREAGMPLGGTAYQPTDEHRKMVEKFAVVLTQETIADLCGISIDTLMRHYRDEYDKSAALGAAGLASIALKKALNGNDRLLVKVLEARVPGWGRKQKVELTGAGGGPIYHVDPMMIANLSDEEFALYERMAEKLGLSQRDDDPDRSSGAGEGEGDQAPAPGGSE